MTGAEYRPIEDYGIVGNLETSALVAPDGSVDWFPYPHVEDPSIFGAILDPERGGRFRVGPAESVDGAQRYVDRTNVLETTFDTDHGTATVTDFFPPAGQVDHPKKVLYRKVTCDDGAVDLEIAFEPRFDYGRVDPMLERTETGIRASGAGERTLLEAPTDLEIDDGRVTGELSLEAGDEAWLLVRCTGAENADTEPEAALAETITYWRGWSHSCRQEGDECVFGGRWHDLAVRSGLALKLLIHEETGAIAAAPTASLPEEIGGVRNWDYRFNWLRDAGFTIQALSNLGHSTAAINYFEWYVDLCQADEPEGLQPVYGLHGETDLTERELDHLRGYRDSRPVRVGNGAADQTQLDIYGEILLAADQILQLDRELADDEWSVVRDIVEYVRRVWDAPDAGMWEVRGDQRQFVYSKVMCWVALDRGIDIATDHEYEAPVEEWRSDREAIRVDVLENGYDEDLGAFVQAYDATTLDATGLLLPIVGFLPFDDERVRGTIDAVEDRLLEADGLVRRYEGDDGLPGDEGAFVLCSCWLVDALALSGRLDDAVDRFDALTDYVNDLGLVAEEIDVDTGVYLGNYPQAFSHIGLVNSTLYLGHMHGNESPGVSPMGIRLGDPVAPDESH